MTRNLRSSPNRLQLHGDVELGTHFGRPVTITPVGACRHPVVKARFHGGVCLEFDQTSATELVKGLVAALQMLGGTK